MTWAMKTRDLLRQGREEGREEGIKALVVALKNFSYAPDSVTQAVAEQFGLSLEDAEERTKLYWDQKPSQ